MRDDARHACWLASSGFLAVVVACQLPVAAAAEGAADQDWITQSRELGQRLTMTLKERLQSAMAEGGPAAAIDVCRIDAPAIAGALSQEAGATVRRTALRVRNPENAPDEFERDVLLDFTARTVRGESVSTLERAEQRRVDGRTERRYMKAIVTEAVCLTCHGSAIVPDVAAAIARAYPDDQATGFEPGELRGALSVTWPAPENP